MSRPDFLLMRPCSSTGDQDRGRAALLLRAPTPSRFCFYIVHQWRGLFFSFVLSNTTLRRTLRLLDRGAEPSAGSASCGSSTWVCGLCSPSTSWKPLTRSHPDPTYGARSWRRRPKLRIEPRPFRHRDGTSTPGVVLLPPACRTNLLCGVDDSANAKTELASAVGCHGCFRMLGCPPSSS